MNPSVLPSLTANELTARIAKQGERPILVEFWAPWCGPCRVMTKVLEEQASTIGATYDIARVNVDEEPEAAEEHGVQSIPTLIVLKDGKCLGRTTGFRPMDKLKAFLADPTKPA